MLLFSHVDSSWLPGIAHCIALKSQKLLRVSHPMQLFIQKSFTAGLSAIDAALILSKCISEAKNIRKPYILAPKAYSVVDHFIFLRKLFYDGITGDDWLLLNDMYVDLTSIVRWEANPSSPINIRQSVWHGGVLSTLHYKWCNNPRLLEVESRFTGTLIGYIPVKIKLQLSVKENDKTISDDLDIADIFNNFFANVAGDIGVDFIFNSQEHPSLRRIRVVSLFSLLVLIMFQK